MNENAHDLRTIYARRFAATAEYRSRVWDVLAPWLARFLPPSGSPPRSRAILDLGCGYGEWINRIPAARRHAMDLNAAAREHLDPDVVFHEQDCTRDWPLPPGSLDAIVTSNFFEHLPDKAALRATLRHALRALRPGGRLIAMGPNIEALGGRYWSFFDHHVALTEASLAEVLALEGFTVVRAIPRFLPYTLVGGRRHLLFFVRAYLALPFAWSLFGRQFLVVAERPVARPAAFDAL